MEKILQVHMHMHTCTETTFRRIIKHTSSALGADFAPGDGSALLAALLAGNTGALLPGHRLALLLAHLRRYNEGSQRIVIRWQLLTCLQTCLGTEEHCLFCTVRHLKHNNNIVTSIHPGHPHAILCQPLTFVSAHWSTAAC